MSLHANEVGCERHIAQIAERVALVPHVVGPVWWALHLVIGDILMTEFGRLDSCYLLLVSQARPPNVESRLRSMTMSQIRTGNRQMRF